MAHELAQAETRDDLERIYHNHNLSTTEEKIAFLTKVMRIRVSLCGELETPEEELFGLEELALSRLWEWKLAE